MQTHAARSATPVGALPRSGRPPVCPARIQHSISQPQGMMAALPGQKLCQVRGARLARGVQLLAQPARNITEAQADLAVDQVSEDQIFKVAVSGNGLERSILFEVLGDGDGQAVVVVGVLENSPADKAGILPGMKLLAISDPIRNTSMFYLNDRPSIRFVRDAFRMQRNQSVGLWFQKDFLTAPPESPPAAPAPPAASTTAPAAAGVEGKAQGAVNSIDSLLSSEDDEPVVAETTVGDELAARYQEAIRLARANNEVEKRVKRRQERMEEDEMRDDSGLILGLLIAFLGPAAIILAVAAGSGFLDNMYLSSLSAFGN